MSSLLLAVVRRGAAVVPPPTGQAYPAFSLPRVAASSVHPSTGLNERVVATDTVRGRTYRTLHYAWAPIVDPVLSYAHVHTYQPAANAVTYACAIQTVDGVKHEATFGGAHTAVCQPGNTVTTDPVGVTIPTGYFWVLTYVHVDQTGHEWRLSGAPLSGSTTAGPVTIYAGSTENQGGDLDYTLASSPNISTVADNKGVFPAMITSGGSDVTVGLWGDSVAAGGGPSGLPVTFPQSSAFTWALYNSGLRWWSTATGTTRANQVGAISAMLPAGQVGATHMLCQHGLNSTGTDIAAENLVLWKKLRGLGVQLFCTTLTPFTSSTNGWTTNAGQTAKPTVVAYNAWVRDGSPIDPTTLAVVATGTPGAIRAGHVDHPLASTVAYPGGYVDVAAACEASPTNPVWDVDGHGGTVMCDGLGLHPLSWVHDTLMRPVVEAWVGSLTV